MEPTSIGFGVVIVAMFELKGVKIENSEIGVREKHFATNFQASSMLKVMLHSSYDLE